MKRSAFLLLVFFLIPLAVADSEYWAVSAEDGTTQDVVHAANFAASMKGSVAITFTGKTFEQARQALVTRGLAETVIVVFDDDDVLVMANEDRYPEVVGAAETYLEDQGFSVDVEGPDMSYFFGEEEPEEEKQACPADARICLDGTAVGRDPETCEFLPCPEPEGLPQEPAPVQEPEPEPAVEPDEQDPNVFVRIWHWFAGIFS